MTAAETSEVRAGARSGRGRFSLARVIAYSLAAAAFAVSFSHVQELATGHGQQGWASWAIAISVELMALAGFSETKTRKAAGRGVLTAVWPVVMGTAMSLGANIATAGPGVWGVVMAAWPSAAFISVAVMVELDPDGTGHVHAQTAEAMDIVRAHMAEFLAAFEARMGEAVHAMQEHGRALTEGVHAHGDALNECMRVHAEQLTAAVRAQLTEAVREFGLRTHELETEIGERLDEVDERTHKRTTELAGQVREHLEHVAEQGRSMGAELILTARTQSSDMAEQMLKQAEEIAAQSANHGAKLVDLAETQGSELAEKVLMVAQQIAEQGRTDGAALVASAQQAAAELGAQVHELTLYTELADMADNERAERAAAERRELAAHVADLASAAHARLSAVRTTSAREPGAQQVVHARKAMRAVTSGAPRTAAVHTEDSRITAEEFVRELVALMGTEPQWAPDYVELEKRTGYRKRWLQLRVAEAREQLSKESGDEEIADAEIVEEVA